MGLDCIKHVDGEGENDYRMLLTFFRLPLTLTRIHIEVYVQINTTQ